MADIGEYFDLDAGEGSRRALAKFGAVETNVKGPNLTLDDLNLKIHPLFKRELWSKIEDYRYDALKQSFVLATKLLHLGRPFLANIVPEIEWQHYPDRIELDESLDTRRLARVDKFLVKMSKPVRDARNTKYQIMPVTFDEGEIMLREQSMWGFTALGDESGGEIEDGYEPGAIHEWYRYAKERGLPHGEFTVHIAREFVDAILKNPPDSEAHICAVFSAAMTLTHELAHVCMLSDLATQLKIQGIDPDVGNSMVNEIGNSFIGWLFDGWLPDPISYIRTFYHVTLNTGMAWQRLATLNNTKLSSFYSIPMAHVQGWVSQDEWARLVTEARQKTPKASQATVAEYVRKNLLGPRKYPFSSKEHVRMWDPRNPREWSGGRKPQLKDTHDPYSELPFVDDSWTEEYPGANKDQAFASLDPSWIIPVPKEPEWVYIMLKRVSTGIPGDKHDVSRDFGGRKELKDEDYLKIPTSRLCNTIRERSWGKNVPDERIEISSKPDDPEFSNNIVSLDRTYGDYSEVFSQDKPYLYVRIQEPEPEPENQNTKELTLEIKDACDKTFKELQIRVPQDYFQRPLGELCFAAVKSAFRHEARQDFRIQFLPDDDDAIDLFIIPHTRTMSDYPEVYIVEIPKITIRLELPFAESTTSEGPEEDEEAQAGEDNVPIEISVEDWGGNVFRRTSILIPKANYLDNSIHKFHRSILLYLMLRHRFMVDGLRLKLSSDPHFARGTIIPRNSTFRDHMDVFDYENPDAWHGTRKVYARLIDDSRYDSESDSDSVSDSDGEDESSELYSSSEEPSSGQRSSGQRSSGQRSSEEPPSEEPPSEEPPSEQRLSEEQSDKVTIEFNFVDGSGNVYQTLDGFLPDNDKYYSTPLSKLGDIIRNLLGKPDLTNEKFEVSSKKDFSDFDSIISLDHVPLGTYMEVFDYKYPEDFPGARKLYVRMRGSDKDAEKYVVHVKDTMRNETYKLYYSFNKERTGRQLIRQLEAIRAERGVPIALTWYDGSDKRLKLVSEQTDIRKISPCPDPFNMLLWDMDPDKNRLVVEDNERRVHYGGYFPNQVLVSDIRKWLMAFPEMENWPEDVAMDFTYDNNSYRKPFGDNEIFTMRNDFDFNCLWLWRRQLIKKRPLIPDPEVPGDIPSPKRPKRKGRKTDRKEGKEKKERKQHEQQRAQGQAQQEAQSDAEQIKFLQAQKNDLQMRLQQQQTSMDTLQTRSDAAISRSQLLEGELTDVRTKGSDLNAENRKLQKELDELNKSQGPRH